MRQHARRYTQVKSDSCFVIVDMIHHRTLSIARAIPHVGAAVLAKLEKDIGTVNASWAHWIERVTPTAEGDSATSPPGDGLLLASTPGTENNDTALYSNALASALQQLDAEVVLHVEETNTNPDHLASYMRYLRLIKYVMMSADFV